MLLFFLKIFNTYTIYHAQVIIYTIMNKTADLRVDQWSLTMSKGDANFQ